MKSNKKKISVTLLISVLLVSFLPAIQTGTALPNTLEEINVEEKGKRINVFDISTMSFSSFEWTYVKHQFSYTDEEKDEFKHLSYKLYIDGEEVQLKRATDIEFSEEGVKTYIKYFYCTFDSGYFAPGMYIWDLVLMDKKEVVETTLSPLIVFEDGHRLKANDINTMTIKELDRAYINHGFSAITEDELHEFGPFTVQVYIDGNEIPLTSVKLKEEGDDGEVLYSFFFWVSFEPEYFTPGQYNLRVVWSNKGGIVYEVSNPLTVESIGNRIDLNDPESLVLVNTEDCYIELTIEVRNPDWKVLITDYYGNKLLEKFIDKILNFIPVLKIIKYGLELHETVMKIQRIVTYIHELRRTWEIKYIAKISAEVLELEDEYEILISVLGEEDEVFGEIQRYVDAVREILEDKQIVMVYGPDPIEVSRIQRTFLRHGWCSGPGDPFPPEPFYIRFFVDEYEVQLDRVPKGNCVYFSIVWNRFEWVVDDYTLKIQFYEGGVLTLEDTSTLIVHP